MTIVLLQNGSSPPLQSRLGQASRRPPARPHEAILVTRRVSVMSLLYGSGSEHPSGQGDT